MARDRLAPKSLLRQRKFLPLFLTQFSGAFNDNMFRNALIVLITFKLTSDQLPADAKILSSIASSLLVAPYVIFSSLAGQLADKNERSRLMRYTKFFEAGVMLVASYGFYTNNIHLLLGLLFGAGMQATFFSPMKYSVLPTHLEKDELIRGNGLVESGTFLAILTGSIAGTALGGLIDINNPNTSLYVSASLLLVAAFGITTAFFIPIAKAAEPRLKVSANLFKSSYDIVKAIIRNKTIFKAVMCTSWFWLCGSVFLSLFPGYVKETLHANTGLYAIFLASFSIGIALGAIATSKILNNKITPKYTHITLFGVTLFTLIMVGLSTLAEKQEGLIGAAEFFGHWFAWPLFLSMVMTAFCWGVYSVPLKTIIQHNSKESERSRVIAGENIFNAVFMVAAGVLNTILLSSGVNVLPIFTIMAIINLLIGIIAYKIWKN